MARSRDGWKITGDKKAFESGGKHVLVPMFLCTRYSSHVVSNKVVAVTGEPIRVSTKSFVIRLAVRHSHVSALFINVDRDVVSTCITRCRELSDKYDVSMRLKLDFHVSFIDIWLVRYPFLDFWRLLQVFCCHKPIFKPCETDLKATAMRSR